MNCTLYCKNRHSHYTYVRTDTDSRTQPHRRTILNRTVGMKTYSQPVLLIFVVEKEEKTGASNWNSNLKREDERHCSLLCSIKLSLLAVCCVISSLLREVAIDLRYGGLLHCLLLLYILKKDHLVPYEYRTSRTIHIDSLTAY
jgi:predicted GIY-YIG superfamily endonuclease